MNVNFKLGDSLMDGYKIINTTGVSQYTASDGFINVCFTTDAGEGRNYSKVEWAYDSQSNRRYSAQKYLFKYVSLVQNFSNQLYMKYKAENSEVSK